MSDDEDADSVESLDYIRFISPPGKARDESYKPDTWNRRVSDLSPLGKRRNLRDERSKPEHCTQSSHICSDSQTVNMSRCRFSLQNNRFIGVTEWKVELRVDLREWKVDKPRK